MIMFIKQVKEQLGKMSEAEKDEWILTQAKLLEEKEQQSFFMSLSGEKKVIYMPSQGEIDKFCEKVACGEIYLEYETHYYEFDDDGRYIDDWKVWHNDPFLAIGFLNRVFMGCHDLMLLNEYKTVVDILDRVCKLEFKVIESPDSEDFEDDSLFTLINAAEESMLSMSISDIGTDWVTAYVKLADKWDSLELAKRLVEIFNQPICKKLNPSMLIGKEIPNDLFSHMFEILNVKILEAESHFNKLFTKTVFTHDNYVYEKKLKRQKEILLNIQMKCIDAIQKKPQYNISVLSASWKQIKELLDVLKYERYVDDQWEVGEIWNICNVLLKTNKLGLEDWELRKNILSDIILHIYYNGYSCYDPMFDLSNELCVKQEEFLMLADIMDGSGYYKKEAAHLYHKYGRDDKYISYLETHLGKESETYVALINYYKEHDNFDRACLVAEQALVKCKDDLTEAFIYLLVDAVKRKDKDKYKKLYSSAKRRRLADINRIDQALSDSKSGSYT